MANNTRGIPTPSPIFAPVDSPPVEGVDVGVNGGKVLMGVDGVVGVFESDVEVRVAARDGVANSLRSVSCHQTGIPSPYML